MSWTRRDALKTFGTGAALLAMPASLRGAFAAQEPELVLRTMRNCRFGSASS